MNPQTSWADDDDDGTLDVNSNAALRARLQQANRATAVSPSPLHAQLALRTRPLEVSVGSEQQVGYLPNQATPVRRSETPGTGLPTQVVPVQRSEASGTGASFASPTTRTNANGIPLLDEGSTSAQNGGVNPILWNAFADNVSASASPKAKALLQQMMQGSSKDASAPQKKPKKRRK